MGKFGNLEIESRIVYEYHAVGGEIQNVLLAAPEVAEQLARLGEYLGEAHDGSFFVVSDKTPYLCPERNCCRACLCGNSGRLFLVLWNAFLMFHKYPVHQITAPKTYDSLGVLLVYPAHQV